MSIIVVQSNKHIGHPIQEPTEKLVHSIHLEDEVVQCWDSVYTSNPRLFDPTGIRHPSTLEEGNCRQYHIRMKEAPCTKLKLCLQNDRRRDEEITERRKNLYHNIRRRKGYQKPQQETVVQPKSNVKPNNKHNDFEDFAEEYFRQ
jgi:hypothetical protein